MSPSPDDPTDESRPPSDRPSPPVALTVAGSDSGGGAGIQADLRTFRAFGVFGTSALTAVTAQNTLGVRAVELVSPELVRAQILAVAGDLAPAAAKTGMLGDAARARAALEALGETLIPALVVDPVMVAQSGDRLLEESAITILREGLLPAATLVTPNLDEAELLLEREVRDEEAMGEAAGELVRLGAGAALVKGGHLEGPDVVDVLYDGRTWSRWRSDRLPGGGMHGTGCTLSAAVTAGLAHGRPLREAVEAAVHFTRRAIRSGIRPGSGAGVPDPLAEP